MRPRGAVIASPPVIAIEVSSAAGKPPYGGIGGAIRNFISELLVLDPHTRYELCYRLSRWRKGDLFRPDAPNARIRVLQDPFNALSIPRARILHSMGIFTPTTPRRIPKLVTIHDLNAVRNTQWVTERWHEKRSARIRQAIERADHVVTYSAFTAGEIQEEYGLPADRVHPVLLGVDTQEFRPSKAETISRLRAEHGDYVIAIGLMNPRKNFVNLVRAIAPIEKLRLVLVGRNSETDERIQAVLDECGMRERVDLLSGLSHETLLGLIGAARICAVPSLYDGFGLTVLEAMACGTPVVCSESASLPEAAGDAAEMVDATDVDAITHGLRRVVESEDLARELRRRGLERAQQMSWKSAAQNLRQLYRDIGGI